MDFLITVQFIEAQCATKAWNDSTLNKIVQLTEEARLNKPKLQRWLDQFGEQYSKVTKEFSVGKMINISKIDVESYTSVLTLTMFSPMVEQYDARTTQEAEDQIFQGDINTDLGISCGVGINDYIMSNTSVVASNKRVSTWNVGYQKEKKQKTETSVLAMCSSVLEDLISHEFGWIFNQPVDPVAPNILDYLTIITKPMDLGTIKSKLEKNDYYGVAEFAADVRLTFSNAMHYNPPINDVHAMAKTMNCIFEKKYKVLQNRFRSDTLLIDTMQKCDPPALSVNRSAPKRSLPSKGKLVRCSSEARIADIVEHPKTNTNSMQKLGKNIVKDTILKVEDNRCIDSFKTSQGDKITNLEKLKHTKELEQGNMKLKVIAEADIDQTLEYFEALERLCRYKPSCRFTRRGNHCYIESSGQVSLTHNWRSWVCS
ncbi:hypothetical protein CsatB_021492 [Cannabis sativa]